MAAIFGCPDHKQLKFECVKAIKSPMPPTIVSNPPCQEVVIKDNIDVAQALPLIKHSEDDAGRILGGGVVLYADPPAGKGSELCFKRMHFRGKDWGSINILPGTHLGTIVNAEFKQGKAVPLTINIGVPPAVMIMAAAYAIHVIIGEGADELGIAGALQGAPIEICKAKTVDAYAIANSEWVIEGYCLAERVWETEEAEKIGKVRVAPLFPEWLGYLGRALRPPRFQATAITHRKDRPIFHTPLAASFENENMAKPIREACFLEFAEGIAPGLVTDVNIPYGIRVNSGVVYQVKKRGRVDDSLLKNLLFGALSASMARLVIAVDEDVNIYNADDILWAITTRMNAQTGISKAPAGAVAVGYALTEHSARSGAGGGEGIAIDATAPYDARTTFKRAHYPSDTIDLSKWLSPEEISTIRMQQLEYARLLADIGG